MTPAGYAICSWISIGALWLIFAFAPWTEDDKTPLEVLHGYGWEDIVCRVKISTDDAKRIVSEWHEHQRKVSVWKVAG